MGTTIITRPAPRPTEPPSNTESRQPTSKLTNSYELHMLTEEEIRIVGGG
jgi:hypothetical protein